MPDANDAFEKPVYDAAVCIEQAADAVLAEATELLGGTASVEEMIAKDIAAGKTAPRLAFDQILAQIIATDYHVFPGTTVTVCCLTLQNGYNTTGVSACVDPSNFNAEIGQKIARDNAIKDIWVLEGYLLKEQLHNASTLDSVVGNLTA